MHTTTLLYSAMSKHVHSSLAMGGGGARPSLNITQISPFYALPCTETLIHRCTAMHWNTDTLVCRLCTAIHCTAIHCCAVNFGTSLECALHWWWERLGLKGNRQEARLHLMNRFKTDEDWTEGWFGKWQIQNTKIKSKEPKLTNIKFYYMLFFVSCILTDMGLGHVLQV